MVWNFGEAPPPLLKPLTLCKDRVFFVKLTVRPVAVNHSAQQSIFY